MCSGPAVPLSSFVTLLVVHNVPKLQLNLWKADSPELVVTQSNAHTFQTTEIPFLDKRVSHYTHMGLL